MDKLLDFLDGWIERNGTLNSSDTDTLKKFMTGLGSEIDSLSVSPPAGSKRLILYGGWNGDVPMWQIAESAANSGQAGCLYDRHLVFYAVCTCDCVFVLCTGTGTETAEKRYA